MHPHLHAGPDRLKAGQPQQVECCCAPRGQRSGPVAPLVVGILLELGDGDPVPALNAPALTNQLQQAFWGGAQAGEK